MNEIESLAEELEEQISKLKQDKKDLWDIIKKQKKELSELKEQGSKERELINRLEKLMKAGWKLEYQDSDSWRGFIMGNYEEPEGETECAEKTICEVIKKAESMKIFYDKCKKCELDTKFKCQYLNDFENKHKCPKSKLEEGKK